MSRLHGLATDGAANEHDGSGVAAGKRTLTSRIPAVQRQTDEPHATQALGKDEDEDEDEEEDDADEGEEEPDDPFGLHLPKPVQMRADADGTTKKNKKTKKKKKKSRGKKSDYDPEGDGVDELGNLTESTRGDKSSTDKTNVFHDELEVLKSAQIYNHKAKPQKGKKIPAGTRVRVIKAGIKRVHVATADGSITEDDNAWVLCKTLGGRGRDVPLGGTDEADQARASQIASSLPPGRNPGKSEFKWSFRKNFYPSVADVALDGGLMTKIHRLIEWAIYNDMVTGDIEFSWGVRSPRDAHKFNVAYEIRQGDHVTLEDLQALPNGEDAYGNKWYRPGDTLESVQAWMVERGLGNNPAASGYPKGEKRRPAHKGKMGISDHCSGHAVDVHIPWRARDGKGTDKWAWEEIYHQFGLTRPLHKDRSPKKKPEAWHIEETGKELELGDSAADIDLGVLDGLID